jgi:hypothetical protein
LKPSFAILNHDPTTEFDHVGISFQPDLSSVHPVQSVRDAQASSGPLRRVRKPGAVPYIVAATAIATAIWTTIGAPHDGLKTASSFAEPLQGVPTRKKVYLLRGFTNLLSPGIDCLKSAKSRLGGR